MTNESSTTPEMDNHDYNCPGDSTRMNTTGMGRIDVVIPAQITEFDPATARALLRLLVEVHRKRNAEHHHTTEEI